MLYSLLLLYIDNNEDVMGLLVVSRVS